ncbi:MAG: helix-turn-helix transcriptional regulator [Bacillota bacterium]|nr:helix-turn-helix transcriptional regulator [Bacillota bacterium]
MQGSEGTGIKSSENYKVTNFKGLRKVNIPYIFIWIVYYAWVIVSATWWTVSPYANSVFSLQLRNMLHTITLISSAVFIIILKKEWFAFAARFGAIAIIIGMLIFITIPWGRASIISAVFIGLSLGCVNAGILIPFVFALNNTEKFYSVVCSNILINIISIIKEGTLLKENRVSVLSFLFLAAALITVIFLKKEDVSGSGKSSAINKIPRRIYLTIFINCTFAVLCKGAGKGVLNIAAGGGELPVLFWYYMGGLLGCLTYIFIFRISKKSIHLAWNIAFACLAMGLIFNAFSAVNSKLTLVFSAFLGAGSSIGMINMYYILGVIGKKYNSMKYIRLSILFIGICGGVSGIIVGNLINDINSNRISVTASIISAAVMLLFLIISPILSQTYYEDEWVGDSEKIEIDNDYLYIFHGYNLSRRELEVCKLLLQGYTLRQISAVLNIAYPTVNTYCTSLYRKLKINSRIELLMIFKEYTIK